MCLGGQAAFFLNQSFCQIVNILRVGVWCMIFTSCLRYLGLVSVAYPKVQWEFSVSDTHDKNKTIFKGFNDSFIYMDPIIMCYR